MSLKFLCKEITWSKQVFLPLDDLIMAILEKKRFPQPTGIIDYTFSQVLLSFANLITACTI
jgi:hypothetical protein